MSFGRLTLGKSCSRAWNVAGAESALDPLNGLPKVTGRTLAYGFFRMDNLRGDFGLASSAPFGG